MIKKVKIEDKELNILVTNGDFKNVSMHDYYSSRLCIHNNIILKNQTILGYKGGESINIIEINQLLNKYKYDKV